jgi:hypothetical protein
MLKDTTGSGSRVIELKDDTVIPRSESMFDRVDCVDGRLVMRTATLEGTLRMVALYSCLRIAGLV